MKRVFISIIVILIMFSGFVFAENIENNEDNEIKENIENNNDVEVENNESDTNISTNLLLAETSRETVDESIKSPEILISTHVSNIGWLEPLESNYVSGTTGMSLAVEAFKMEVSGNGVEGTVEYTSYVQGSGWQPYVAEGEISGTTGQSKKLEAIRMRLTGELAERYNLYYRVHVANIGWLDWTMNDEKTGTSGFGYQIEAIMFNFLPKDEFFEMGPDVYRETAPNVYYTTHVENIGWQNYVKSGELGGTTGQSLRLEGIKIKTDMEKSIVYSTHIQDIGWQDFVSQDKLSGTTGQAKRLEAIKIRLKGDMKIGYDVYYRVHAQNFGWLDWAKNGEPAGTEGFSYRLEGIEIVLVEKGGEAPGPTDTPFKDRNEYVIGKMYIDSPKEYSANKSDNLEVVGWAVSSSDQVGLKFYLDNKEIIPSKLIRTERNDVLAAFPEYNTSVNQKSGFTATFDLSNEEPGGHKITVKLIKKSNEILIEDKSEYLTIYNSIEYGVDVSEHQDTIDWAKVKDQISFAIIRCGYGMDKDDYGGYSQDDTEYYKNMDACKKYNIPTDIYLYSYADSIHRAEEEANHVIRLARPYKDQIGIVWYDLEDNSVFNQIREGRMTKEQYAKIIKTFVNKLNAEGYIVGIYASMNYLENYFLTKTLNNHEVWVAHYTGATMQNWMNNMNEYNGKYKIWQFASDGKINGIPGLVDLNIKFK